MNKKTKRNLRNGLAYLAFSIAIAAGAFGIYKSFEALSYVDRENPQEVCDTGEDDVDEYGKRIVPTRRDVNCDTFVTPNRLFGKLRVQQRKAPSQNPCEKYMRRGEDGKCEYFPPEYFDKN